MPNISRTKTWNANETLTAADLNAEFNGILTGVNDNTLNNDNLNQTDDYLFGSLVTGSGLAAGGGDGKLHVHVADAGSVTAHASGNDFVIEGTANPGMSFLSGASTTNSIYFGDVNDNDAGSIVYTHGADMAFTVETVEVLTLAAASVTNNVNTFVGNGYGAVIGHTAQETISDGGGATDVVPEFQILGTAAADMTAMIGGWSTTATRAAAPVLALVKSGHASIGSHTVVTDGEILGSIIAYGDDGTDLEAPAAAIEFAVDGTPGTGDMPGEIKFYTTADAGETLTLALTLSAAQAATFAGAVTVASLVCTAGATFGGGIGSTGVTISTAGVIQANGAITSDGAVTGATLAGTISTATQNSITTATSLASVGTITSGTWSGVIDGSCTMTLGSDATGDVYFRDASGFLEKLAASTDGHVLTSTGAGSIPAWEAIPSSGLDAANGVDDRIATFTDSDSLNGEANLTFSGSNLAVLGTAGIGIARTEGTLHVHTATAGGSTTANVLYDDLVVENGAAAGISILTPNTTTGTLAFGDEDNDRGYIQYSHADHDSIVANTMAIRANGGSDIYLYGTAPTLGINETANAGMGTGITINQHSHDTQIFTLKSSDVNNEGIFGESDDYFTIQKSDVGNGCARLTSAANDALGRAWEFYGYSGVSSTSPATTASAGYNLYWYQHANGTLQNATANACIFSVGVYKGGSTQKVFIVDEDGNLFSDESATVGTFDHETDALMLRAGRHGLLNGGVPLWMGADPEEVERMKNVLEENRIIIWNRDTDSVPFLNHNKAIMVAWDGLYQAHGEREELRGELAELRQENIKLASRLNLLEN